MGAGKASAATPDRQVFLSVVRSAAGRRDGRPDVAVIELDLQALLDIITGISQTSDGSGKTAPPFAMTEVAWTTVPNGNRGYPYEAAMIVRDCAMQWGRALWMDEAVLESFNAVPTRPSRCLRHGTGYVWEVDHPDFGSMRTDAVSLIDILCGVLFLGDPFHVREMCVSMTTLCPEVLATALLAGAGPRFGVAGRGITRRSIVDLVGHDELRPLLFHGNERVRRAAAEALGEEGPAAGQVNENSTQGSENR